MSSGEQGGGEEEDAKSAAFDLLHEKVQRWIWKQGWEELRDIQEESIPILLTGMQDLIIAAGTASGKTEAAFLPIVSKIAEQPGERGFKAIYVGPLRALINDQFGRLEALCDELDIPVTKWHGDVSAAVKERARRKPDGILLITPESIEAILARRGEEAPKLFRALQYIVVDELHAFFGSARGKQLQSLLHRIEVIAGRKIPRVGLSATLADMKFSSGFLRPLDPDAVRICKAKGGSQELRLQLRGYLEPRRALVRTASEVTSLEDDSDNNTDGVGNVDAEIVRHLFSTLRGKRSLIFAGSRNRVELYSAKLNELTERANVPEEFFAHHGSLSIEFRSEAERRMKDESRPASIVCTTTLELGIDIGHIESVAQIGPGHTVSGMRQRLGRSGRRPGKPSVMRIYVQETELDERSHPLDALRRETIQAIAMVNLMLAKWNEPVAGTRLDLSTLVHQVLALIAQNGGVSAKGAWESLCESRVFEQVSVDLFKRVLRRMADKEIRLIEQAEDGTLLPGENGERVIASRDFYTVFMTPEEYKVVTDRGRSLGSLPLELMYQVGQLIIFGGRRWKILEVDTNRKEILVTAARGGKPPKFGGDGSPPADEVVAEMRRIYTELSMPAYLDKAAISLVTEGRQAFDRFDLRSKQHCHHGDSILLFPWVGPASQEAFVLCLLREELEAAPMGLAIGVKSEHGARLKEVLRKLSSSPPPVALELAALVAEKEHDKYDWSLGEDLLCEEIAIKLNVGRVPEIAGELKASLELDA